MADIHTLVSKIDRTFEFEVHYHPNQSITEVTDYIEGLLNFHTNGTAVIPLPQTMFSKFRDLLQHIEKLEDALEDCLHANEKSES